MVAYKVASTDLERGDYVLLPRIRTKERTRRGLAGEALPEPLPHTDGAVAEITLSLRPIWLCTLRQAKDAIPREGWTCREQPRGRRDHFTDPNRNGHNQAFPVPEF